MRVLLGVGGGVAAYKAAELVRRLRQQNWTVQVAMTRAAREFIAPLTFAALTGERVLTELFAPDAGGDAAAPIEHIAAAQAADALVVAPATAHCLARFAHGLADDYLATLYLACAAPVILAPAMNVNMWRHPATRANLEALRARPHHVIVEPEAGYLACGMEGEGRLADPERILGALRAAVGAGAAAAAAPGPELVSEPAPDRDWSGRSLLITAGPTREALDPVRYLSNRSSGRMGFALALAAAERGARVALVHGPCAAPAPAHPAIRRVAVTTAEEMLAAALAEFPAAEVAILAAAVSDYRARAPEPVKMKKSAAPPRLELEATPDILAELGRRKRHQFLAGFAAETGSPVAAARAKLAAKNADLIVANDVSREDIGFDAADNEVHLVAAEGEEFLPRADKRRIADQILDAIQARRRGSVRAPGAAV